jgi:S-(hydroxymethyl)glutathione dehydrogenase/alcohol dehydrogenase
LADESGEVAVGFGVGTFAEETVVPAEAVVVIDKSVPFEIAALVGCGVMTGVGAVINAAKVEPGASVAVIGAGGVGINVIQAAKLSGATIIAAIDRVENKLSVARQFGATHAFLAETAAEAAKETTSGAGFDYVFEVVGRSATIRQAWDLTRRGGTTVIVGGGSPDDVVEFNAGELFSSERTLMGSIYGSADVRVDFHRVLDLWKAGLLDLEGLVSNEIGLEDVNTAFDAIRKGEAVRSIIRFA